jgi:hypothetical protein
LGVARGGDGAARHRSARGLCPRSLPDKARDPEMHQTKKGKQWYFGMKALNLIKSMRYIWQPANRRARTLKGFSGHWQTCPRR